MSELERFKGKVVCNHCPELEKCDAVCEWYSPEYSFRHMVQGLPFPTLFSTKDGECPYGGGNHRPTQAELEDIFREGEE